MKPYNGEKLYYGDRLTGFNRDTYRVLHVEERKDLVCWDETTEWPTVVAYSCIKSYEPFHERERSEEGEVDASFKYDKAAGVLLISQDANYIDFSNCELELVLEKLLEAIRIRDLD